MSDLEIPDVRVRAVNGEGVREDADYVLYWMIAARRPRYNFALDRAVQLAREQELPLLVLEPLRIGYRWASDRFHAFVVEGMRDNAAVFGDAGVAYYPYVEREEGQGKGLLSALAERAAAVVTDDYPTFFLPRMVDRAGEALDVRLEAVDSNGIYPMHATDRVFARAFDFRRHLQEELGDHLLEAPHPDPTGGDLAQLDGLPEDVLERWPRVTEDELADPRAFVAELDIDHDVPPAPQVGGECAARERLEEFLSELLAGYDEDRNQPDLHATSNLSPWLHFGHLSAHEVFSGIAESEDWTPDDLSGPKGGKRSGWWGMSESAEAFLDQLVTWRELGFNHCAHVEDGQEYEALPDWARETLEEHADDERPSVYTLEEFEAGETHDELWNAAQAQLRAEGFIHNYLRMLWGKKILHWSESPREALRIMIELNNKYALDGRDPNSYSGIFWVMGRYDRAWGPEREVFGKIRYMTSDNTRRKLKLKDYLERWSNGQVQLEL